MLSKAVSKLNICGPVRFTVLFLLMPLAASCERPDPEIARQTAVPTLIQINYDTPVSTTETPTAVNTPTATKEPLASPSASYPGTPTPNPTRAEQPEEAATYTLHVVQDGETLTQIAEVYGTTPLEIAVINGLVVDDFLSVGQELMVPEKPDVTGPSFKIIPDSELVYGPTAVDFDVTEASVFFEGYLLNYQEEVEGVDRMGPEIIQLIADRFSMNPRLLFALLEHQSGWVTQQGAVDDGFPMGYVREEYEGLYRQLSWAANLVNLGFYGRSEGGIYSFEITDEATVQFAGDINHATAGIQLFLGNIPGISYEEWTHAAGPDGFFTTYSRLFGNPFIYTYDPLWPEDLAQPPMSLPWESGRTWYFTSGPHGGWASGSAWAALDFAPQNEQLGCYQSDEWVTSMSDGLVVRSDDGAVVIDLDGDGYAGTGWAITYMHLEERDRVPSGIYVVQGDRLGHPSCEGGFSNGTHVHIARTYNGRWVSADGDLPFRMGGWISQGLGREYDGLLVKGDIVKEACSCREEGNAITAE